MRTLGCVDERADRLPEGELAATVYQQLGEATHVKRWLVRLYLHRLRKLVEHSGIIHILVMQKSVA